MSQLWTQTLEGTSVAEAQVGWELPMFQACSNPLSYNIINLSPLPCEVGYITIATL